MHRLRNGHQQKRAFSKDESCLPTHITLVWENLSPRERLRRSWRLRYRLPSPQEVHDEKLFPRP